DGREARDRPAAQVIAVAESAGKHERVDPAEVVVAMPERDRLGAGPADGALRVAVVERPREGDDADAGQCVSPATPAELLATSTSRNLTPTTSSMTELERRESASSRAAWRAASSAGPSTVSSNRLPIRTAENGEPPS